MVMVSHGEDDEDILGGLAVRLEFSKGGSGAR